MSAACGDSGPDEPLQERTQIILYVSDQAAACRFYRAVLGVAPSLDVPGMAEFPLPRGALSRNTVMEPRDSTQGKRRP